MTFSLINYIIAYALVGTLLACLAAFIYFKDKKNILFRIFSLYNLSIAWWCFFSIPAIISRDHSAGAFWCRIFISGVIFTPTLVLHCAYLLLDYLKEKKYQIILKVSYALSIIFFLLNFTPLFIRGAETKPTFLSYTVPGPFFHLHVVHFFVVMLYAETLYLIRYLKNKQIEGEANRKYLFYFLSSSIATLGGGSNYFPVYGFEVPVLNPFGTYTIALYGLVLTYTIIRYKLLELETVIHKTIAWFFSTAGLVMVFVLIFISTDPWHKELNSFALFGYITVYTLTCLYLLQKLQPGINRFFQRGRFNMDLILQEFSNELVHLKGLEELTGKIKTVVQDNLFSEKVAILLYDSKKQKLVPFGEAGMGEDHELILADPLVQWATGFNRIINRDFIEVDPDYKPVIPLVSAYLKKFNCLICIPLVLNGRLLGLINLARKSNLQLYGMLDYHFLKQLKNQATIAVSNSLLYQTIEDEVKLRTGQLVETQKQLVQAEKLATVGTLAGGVAHEINNPLTAIMTNVQMILSSGENIDADTRESLELMEEATKRCKTIVQKLMTYAKKPMGPEELKKINLAEVIKGVKAFLGYQLQQENVKLVTGWAPGEYWVTGNHNELEQIVTNIVLNGKDAIKRVKKSGTICVNLFEDRGKACIEIRDEGCGIPQDIRNKIFDPFFTTKEVGKGVGLGLSICQSIVEKHGGTIEVTSEINKGTSFTVKIPITEGAV